MLLHLFWFNRLFKRLFEMCPGTYFLLARWVNGWDGFRFRYGLNWRVYRRYAHAPHINWASYQSPSLFLFCDWIKPHSSHKRQNQEKSVWVQVIYIVLTFPKADQTEIHSASRVAVWFSSASGPQCPRQEKCWHSAECQQHSQAWIHTIMGLLPPLLSP